jgi:hypothetical protein
MGMASARAGAGDGGQNHDLDFLRELVAVCVGKAEIEHIVRGAQIHGVEVDAHLAEHDRGREVDGGRSAVFHDRRRDAPGRIERDRHAVSLGRCQ